MLTRAKELGFEEVPPWDVETWEECDEIPPWESCEVCGRIDVWWDMHDGMHCMVCDPPVDSLVKLGQTMIVGNTAGSDTKDQAAFGLGLLKRLRAVGAVASDFRAAPLAAEAERKRLEARREAEKARKQRAGFARNG